MKTEPVQSNLQPGIKLSTGPTINNIVVFGATGTIGNQFIQQLLTEYPDASIHAVSRNMPKLKTELIIYHTLNYHDEIQMCTLALTLTTNKPLDMVVVATGLLHDENMMPEKSLKELSAKNFMKSFEVNTILPALLIKHFMPKLNKQSKSVFVLLTAKVGSISDNRLGGWYAYRASKAALNMLIKTAAIEIGRFNKQAIIIGLHPGTVDSALSRPFQKNIPDGKLFNAAFSVTKMIDVIKKLTPENTGKLFAWDGKEINP